MSRIRKPIKDEYSQNKKTKLTVTNKPVYQEEALIGYEPTVTIQVKLPFQKSEYSFDDEDAIADFVGQIDVEDPQQRLV